MTYTHEFGFSKNVFPASVWGHQSSDDKAVQDYLDKLDKEFAIIIISEKMDESLVLMKIILK